MKLIDVIIAAEGRVIDGDRYTWRCYGDSARYMEFADADGLEFCTVLFDTKTFDVYELDLFVPGTDQCFKWLNPDTMGAMFNEARVRNVDPFHAWDKVQFSEITDPNTMMEYVKDIAATYYDNLPIYEA
jgi:hypothetical protein